MNVEDLLRYNQTYKVFKSLRGTCMYFEECKHNLMALIRQYGCPSAFLTLSCNEYDWEELLQEIAETVYRRKFSKKELDKMTEKEKKKLISDNVVMTTIHFSKRFQKLFALMKYDFLKTNRFLTMFLRSSLELSFNSEAVLMCTLLYG